MIADTRDFGIGRRVCTKNWRARRAVGDGVNQRLCDAQAADAQPAPDVVTLSLVTRPSKTADGLHAPALCFGDPRVMALLSALLLWRHLLVGFRNQQLVRLMNQLLGHPYSQRQATYDLRRLRRKGLIVRLAGSQRYQLTPLGAGWRSCSPRHTFASSRPASLCSTLPCLPTLLNGVRWPTLGVESTAKSTLTPLAS